MKGGQKEDYYDEQDEYIGSDEYDDEMSGQYDNQRGASKNSNAGDGMNGSGPMSDSKDPKSKTKRRSKNDNSGRDFVCGCKKRYLSYPALYTHIKQKHNGITPPGTNTSQHFTGRGRGRPRKTLIEIEQNRIRVEVDGYGKDYVQETDIWVNNTGNGPSEQEMMQLDEKIMQENTYFLELGSQGGPTNPLEWFCDQSHLKFSLPKMLELAKL